ncbi:MAG: PilZ domain-containing protein [Planctomycetota bacterium]
MHLTNHERRVFHRDALRCPAKVYEPRGRRYHAGVTCNVSEGGALLEVRNGAPCERGQLLGLAVDWAGDYPVMRPSDLEPVVVMHVETREDDPTVQYVGVQFTSTQQMPRMAA